MSTPKNAKLAEKSVEKNESEWITYKSIAGKSTYGHRLGTLASAMDALIEAGKFTEVEIAEKLSVMEFSGGKKSLARCKQAIKNHLGYLPSKGVVIEINPKTRAIRAAKLLTEKTK